MRKKVLMENFVILTVKKILVAKYVLFCDAVTNVRKNMGVGVVKSRKERQSHDSGKSVFPRIPARDKRGRSRGIS